MQRFYFDVLNWGQLRRAVTVGFVGVGRTRLPSWATAATHWSVTQPPWTLHSLPLVSVSGCGWREELALSWSHQLHLLFHTCCPECASRAEGVGLSLSEGFCVARCWRSRWWLLCCCCCCCVDRMPSRTPTTTASSSWRLQPRPPWTSTRFSWPSVGSGLAILLFCFLL